MEQKLGGLYPSGPAREKYWHERSPEEKIERLGEVVEYLAAGMIEAQKTIELLKDHSHNPGGDVCSPLVKKRDEHISFFLRFPLGREQNDDRPKMR